MTPPASIKDLHAAVDQKAAALATLHQSRLRCAKGCAACCVDNLTVFQVEADRIRAEAGPVLKLEPAARGQCAFLDESGACRIYTARPYVCRTQGLPLAWVEEDEGEWVEYRDICQLNEDGPPLETLPEDACWRIGEAEQHLARLQANHPSGPGARIALRDLFQTGEP